MKVNELIKIYNENYSFYQELKKSLKKDKVILLPIAMIFISAIAFYCVYVWGGILYKIPVMVGLVILYLGSIQSSR